ncbi:hypothetical protein JTB14_035580 [Gonioctena quinquepunctata]|nr:hypothetical protein JTB14_035580 [Gonioctena quinquepunctata]
MISATNTIQTKSAPDTTVQSRVIKMTINPEIRGDDGTAFLLKGRQNTKGARSGRVYFSKCGVGGFSCITTKSKTLHVTYQCPNGSTDVIFMINQFSSPSNIETLTIKHCKKLTMSMRCSGEKKNIQSLHVHNIGSLRIQRLPYQSNIPAKVVFENIEYLEAVPSFTFSQVDKNMHTTGCILPKNDFNTISLMNVTIDTVQSHGFYMTKEFGDVTFSEVKINRLQSSSILATMSKNSQFLMEKSTVEVADSLAFQVYAGSMVFRETHFTEISPNAINGTVETFNFTKNSVNTLQPHAINLLSKNVLISDNRFEYLKSGALEKITPGLLTDVSGKNFAKLKFSYEFTGNDINFMDAGCLNPDFEAYEHVASDMSFMKNTVYCSCENSGWLLSETGHGYNTALVENFYETFLDKENFNNCSFSCDLPIAETKMMIQGGKCLENITIEWLCQHQFNYLSTSTSVPHVSIQGIPRSVLHKNVHEEVHFLRNAVFHTTRHRVNKANGGFERRDVGRSIRRLIYGGPVEYSTGKGGESGENGVGDWNEHMRIQQKR